MHISMIDIPLIEELLAREAYPAPKIVMNPEVRDFYHFTVADFSLENYQTGPQIKGIPVAV